MVYNLNGSAWILRVEVVTLCLFFQQKIEITQKLLFHFFRRKSKIEAFSLACTDISTIFDKSPLTTIVRHILPIENNLCEFKDNEVFSLLFSAGLIFFCYNFNG